MDDNDFEYEEIFRDIVKVLKSHGNPALGDAPAEDIAQEWIDAGFEDPDEVDDWLVARCFRADVAYSLESAGITPEQASLRATAGTSNYEDTIGYKITNGDLSIEEAKRIITSHFWNS